MYFLSKIVIFHCYVSLPESNLLEIIPCIFWLKNPTSFSVFSWLVFFVGFQDLTGPRSSRPKLLGISQTGDGDRVIPSYF